MNDLNNLYKNWIKDEVSSPDVEAAKEAFLKQKFPPTPVPAAGAFWGAPSFRFALVGCMALLLVLKINPIDHATVLDPAQVTVPALVSENQTSSQVVDASEQPQTQIKKLGSQMGPTVAYQKNFSDVQITVVWVFPKGA